MRYRAEIDGLRAVAVIPVILFHAGFPLFSGGFVGVDIFFVISGYLITTIILDELEHGRFSLTNFYERRARRILPALFFVTAVSLPFAWLWLPPQDMQSFAQSLVAVSVYASNILFWQTSDYFATAAELKPLLHTWSLAVEEQYYLLFPLFLMLTWRLGKRWILAILAVLAGASLMAAQWASVAKPAAAFYLLPTRGWELLVGAFVAFYLANENRWRPGKAVRDGGGAVGFALLAYAIFAFDRHTPFPSLFALVPTVGTALIILCATQETLAGALIGNKIFVGIGAISYSAYLWHQPLFAFARHGSLDEPSKPLLGTLAVVSIALAYVSWRYVETPFRNKTRFSRQEIFAYSAVGSSLLVAFGVAGHVSDGFPGRLDSRFDVLAGTSMKIFENQVRACWQRFDKAPKVESACLIGSKGDTASFALVGDSHAGALLHELDAYSRENNITGLNYTYRSCPPLKDINPKRLTDEDEKCTHLRNSFFAGLSSGPQIPGTVIVNARWALLMERERFKNGEGGNEDGDDWVWDLPQVENDYANSMERHLIESMNSILSSGRKVILIYPVPEMGWQVPARLTKAFAINGKLERSDASTAYERYVVRNKRAIAALDAIGDHKNLVRIKPDRLLCDSFEKSRCVAHLDGAPLYFDDDHLSNEGSRLVVAEIAKHVSGGKNVAFVSRADQ